MVVVELTAGGTKAEITSVPSALTVIVEDWVKKRAAWVYICETEAALTLDPSFT